MVSFAPHPTLILQGLFLFSLFDGARKSYLFGSLIGSPAQSGGETVYFHVSCSAIPTLLALFGLVWLGGYWSALVPAISSDSWPLSSLGRGTSQVQNPEAWQTAVQRGSLSQRDWKVGGCESDQQLLSSSWVQHACSCYSGYFNPKCFLKGKWDRCERASVMPGLQLAPHNLKCGLVALQESQRRAHAHWGLHPRTESELIACADIRTSKNEIFFKWQ